MRTDCTAEVVLEDRLIKAVFDPSLGGKMRSLQSKVTGFEYLYVDNRHTFEGPGYSGHDISGLDECFPSVADCGFPSGPFEGCRTGDHGGLWKRQWNWRQTADFAVMECVLDEFGVTFRRECRLETPGTLCFNYTLRNESGGQLPYIYAAHLMLALHEETEVMLPPDLAEVFIYAAINSPGDTEGEWQEITPALRDGLSQRYSPYRHSAVKCFSNRLLSGKCAVHHRGSAEWLEITFDSMQLPYLGIMISQGFGPGGDCDGEMILGLEPTTSVGDELATSETTGTTAYILNGSERVYWIRLELRGDSTAPEWKA